MGFLSILGKMPVSTSATGVLDALDIKKTLRLAIVAFVGAFLMSMAAHGDVAALVGILFADPHAFYQLLVDATNAGLMALAAAFMELIRRFFANQSV